MRKGLCCAVQGGALNVINMVQNNLIKVQLVQLHDGAAHAQQITALMSTLQSPLTTLWHMCTSHRADRMFHKHTCGAFRRYFRVAAVATGSPRTRSTRLLKRLRRSDRFYVSSRCCFPTTYTG